MCESSSITPSNELVLYSPSHVVDINGPQSPSSTMNVFVQLHDITNVSTLPSNTHTMVSRSKACLFQPKALISTISPNCILYVPINYK